MNSTTPPVSTQVTMTTTQSSQTVLYFPLATDTP